MHTQEKFQSDYQRPSDRGLNFLLVDDDELCLFIHRRILELTGYCNSLRTARHGKDALGILNGCAGGSEALPDIILLDLEMPTMNGIAFLEAFRQLDDNVSLRIPIVLLSSTVRQRDKECALSLGAVHCLSKPLTKDAIDTVIDLIYLKELSALQNNI